MKKYEESLENWLEANENMIKSFLENKLHQEVKNDTCSKKANFAIYCWGHQPKIYSADQVEIDGDSCLVVIKNNKVLAVFKEWDYWENESIKHEASQQS